VARDEQNIYGVELAGFVTLGIWVMALMYHIKGVCNFQLIVYYHLPKPVFLPIV